MAKPANSTLSGYGTTIFTVMSGLAEEHRAINLGQGFPDEEGPEDIRQYAAKAALHGNNQYPPMMGIPELRRAVAEHSKRFFGLDFDWQSQVMVTSGATEALAASILGLIEPGDEAVLIEPLYDSYLPILQLAGATPRLVRIKPPDWQLPREALAEAFSEKTKLIILNSPMNPSAKVFDHDGLGFIAGLVKKHDAYAICDEVYEHLVFESRHTPLISLPGMAERALRIGSAGKTFSLTGWKVGYVSGPEALITAAAKAHQFLTFTTAPNLQHAVAYGLGKPDSYFASLAGDLRAKKELLAKGLADMGMGVLDSQGTYFVTADFSPLGFNGSDEDFCRHITQEAGVAAVPVSAFYQENGPDHFARFCFCKQDEVLLEALARLKAHFGG